MPECSGGSDGRNVVRFASMPKGILGVTCPRLTVRVGSMAEADVAFNTNELYDAVQDASCAGRAYASLEAIATHEFGHLLGLDHPNRDPGHYPHLSMGYQANPFSCNNWASSLGAGDHRALSWGYDRSHAVG